VDSTRGDYVVAYALPFEVNLRLFSPPPLFLLAPSVGPEVIRSSLFFFSPPPLGNQRDSEQRSPTDSCRSPLDLVFSIFTSFPSLLRYSRYDNPGPFFSGVSPFFLFPCQR